MNFLTGMVGSLFGGGGTDKGSPSVTPALGPFDDSDSTVIDSKSGTFSINKGVSNETIQYAVIALGLVGLIAVVARKK